MIEQLSTFPDNVLAFVGRGQVTRADYDAVLVPAVEKALARHNRVRLYYEIATDFTSIDPGAMWEDFKVGVEHLTRWERVAVVTDVEWIRHTIRLFGFRWMAPAHGNDEAVCEAVRRPTMRFVPVKSPEQQAALSMHRTRDLLVKQRTQLVNMIRGLLAEFGIDIPKGLERALLMARRIVDGEAPDIPIEAAKIVGTLSQQALDIHVRLRQIDRDLLVWQRGNDVARRLMTIPGIGPVGATALAASVTDPYQFRSGRQFAAWLGLTPLQKSSGGKERLGRITKMGDKYLRKLLIVGMTSLVGRAKYNPEAIDPRLANLLARKPMRLATVAMANKTARIIWAIMVRGETYRAGHQPALAA